MLGFVCEWYKDRKGLTKAAESEVREKVYERNDRGSVEDGRIKGQVK